jgi:predicted DNA-binding transcriptional regulator YafY
VTGSGESSIRALAKLQQVLPPRLRARVAALGSSTTSLAADGPSVDPEVLAGLARSAVNGERARFDYAAADGAPSLRLVEPHGLVTAGRRWYLVAWDTDRMDWRTFRVDRIRRVRAVPGRWPRRELPASDDASFVATHFEDLAPTFEARATVRMSAREVELRMPDSLRDVEAIDETTSRVRLHADTIEWLAFRLILLGGAFVVDEPPELARYVAALGLRLRGGREPAAAVRRFAP